jgi:SAM-dependent methyltransferase
MAFGAEFAARGPWVTRFEIDGTVYGGDYDAAHDAAERVEDFHAQFPEVASILELGSLEGGHTVCLARLPGVTRVVGIEGRSDNVARARFVTRILNLSNVDFRVADLEEFDVASVGRVDAIFNCGLLYHLAHPVRLLARWPPSLIACTCRRTTA